MRQNALCSIQYAVKVQNYAHTTCALNPTENAIVMEMDALTSDGTRMDAWLQRIPVEVDIAVKLETN